MNTENNFSNWPEKLAKLKRDFISKEKTLLGQLSKLMNKKPYSDRSTEELKRAIEVFVILKKCDCVEPIQTLGALFRSRQEIADRQICAGECQKLFACVRAVSIKILAKSKHNRDETAKKKKRGLEWHDGFYISVADIPSFITWFLEFTDTSKIDGI